MTDQTPNPTDEVASPTFQTQSDVESYVQEAIAAALQQAATAVQGFTRRILNEETEDFDIHFADDVIREMIAEIDQGSERK